MTVRVRAASWLDIATLLRIRNGSQAVKASSRNLRISWREHLRWFRVKENRKLTFLVHDQVGLLGYVRFARTLQAKEFLWSFAKFPPRNKVGTKLTRSALEYFCSTEDCERVHAVVKESNAHSVRIHRELGFCFQTRRIPGITVRDDEILMSFDFWEGKLGGK